MVMFLLIYNIFKKKLQIINLNFFYKPVSMTVFFTAFNVSFNASFSSSSSSNSSILSTPFEPMTDGTPIK